MRTGFIKHIENVLKWEMCNNPVGLDAIIDDMVAFWDRWSSVVEEHIDESVKVSGALLGLSVLEVGIIGGLLFTGLAAGPSRLVVGLIFIGVGVILLLVALSYSQHVFLPLILGEEPKGTLANTIIYNFLKFFMWVVIGGLMMLLLVLTLMGLESLVGMLNASQVSLRVMPMVYLVFIILWVVAVFVSQLVDGYISGQIYRVVLGGESPWSVIMDAIIDVVLLSHRFVASIPSVLGGMAMIFLANMVVGMLLFILQIGIGMMSLCIPLFGIIFFALAIVVAEVLRIHLATLIYPFMIKRALDRGI